MTSHNVLLEKMGLPTVTQEEHQQFANIFSSLQNGESLSASVTADTPAADKPLELGNVYYINFNPRTDTLSPELAKALTDVKENVDLSNSFFSQKAAEAVKDKIAKGDLTDTAIPKANYEAKVLNYLAANSPWIGKFSTRPVTRNWKVEKSAFHNKLVKDFTEGLGLEDTVTSKFEGLLTNIKKTINGSNDTKSNDGNLTFFILMTGYRKDDVLKTFQPSIRTVYFLVKQSLSNYTKTKGDPSSGQNVDVHMEYVESEGAFNNTFFVSDAKGEVLKSVQSATNKFIYNPINVDV